MIKPGDIFTQEDGDGKKARVVVYLVDQRGNIFYNMLDGFGGGAVCHGAGSEAHFRKTWTYEATMTFAGAWKKFKNERYAHATLRQGIKDLVR